MVAELVEVQASSFLLGVAIVVRPSRLQGLDLEPVLNLIQCFLAMEKERRNNVSRQNESETMYHAKATEQIKNTFSKYRVKIN